MNRFLPKRLLIFLCIFLAAPVFAQQHFGSIGDLELTSGEVLRDCCVEYRTFGELNEEKSNMKSVP